MTLTREQRVALKQVYDRGPIRPSLVGPNWTGPGLTYRQFRRNVRPGFDCLMVPWCGMWLGIETDGHTHS